MNTALIFWQFLKRDMYVLKHRIRTLAITYVVITPALYTFENAYLRANLFFAHGGSKLNMVMFTGDLIFLLMIITYKITVDLLFDLEQTKFTHYQMSVLGPRLFLLERIVFRTMFTFVLLLPFFPIAKLLARDLLDTSNISWPLTFLILLLGSLCGTAYHQLAMCILKGSHQIGHFWSRFNITILMLGGSMFPWHTAVEFSKVFGYALLLNPFIYVTEGLRQTIIGGPEFISLKTCIAALMTFSIIFIIMGWYFFKKKTDHI